MCPRLTDHYNAHMIGIGSMLRMVHTKHPVNSRKERDYFENDIVKIENFYNNLLVNENIFINNNKIIFLSLSHDEKVVRQMLSSIIKCLKKG
jgi:glutamate-1-semialdehyde aminotransferase